MTRRTEPRAQASVHTAMAVGLSPDRRRCPVCEGAITPGEGVATRYEGMTLVLRGTECRARFEKDPERYLRDREDSGVACSCEPAESPASEWCCDR